MDSASFERPITISPPVWAFLRSAFEAESPEALQFILRGEGYVLPTVADTESLFAAIIETPGPFLLRMGILKRPELLRGVVLSVEIECGLHVEHVVKRRTIEGLAKGDALLVLYRLLDNQEYVLSRDRLVRTIQEGGWEDHIEGETEEGLG